MLFRLALVLAFAAALGAGLSALTNYAVSHRDAVKTSTICDTSLAPRCL